MRIKAQKRQGVEGHYRTPTSLGHLRWTAPTSHIVFPLPDLTITYSLVRLLSQFFNNDILPHVIKEDCSRPPIS